MQQAFAVMIINTAISALLYFGLAGAEKFLLPQLISSLPVGSWSAPASWSSWTPSVAIPVGVTAWRMSPKLGGLALGGIVSMWGGFMITDLQQPPFINELLSAFEMLAKPPQG
jgi:hypothetical protein